MRKLILCFTFIFSSLVLAENPPKYCYGVSEDGSREIELQLKNQQYIGSITLNINSSKYKNNSIVYSGIIPNAFDHELSSAHWTMTLPSGADDIGTLKLRYYRYDPYLPEKTDYYQRVYNISCE